MFLSSQTAPGRWLHAITIIYPDAGCQGVSSAGLFPAPWCFLQLTDRCSSRQWLREAGSGCWTNFLRVARHSLSPVKLAALRLLCWQLRGCWVALVPQSVCMSIPTCLSFQSVRDLPAQICQADGGQAFYMSLEGGPDNTICGPQCSMFEPYESRLENRCGAMHGPDSLKNPSPVCDYLLPGSFRRTLHLLFIPWNKAGPWREHTHTYTLARTYTLSQMGLLLLLKSRQLWGEREEGQLGFAYVAERRNYISHKAQQWKWTSCPWFVDQISSSWLRNHRIIRTKKLWATLFVPPLLFPRTEVILLLLPPSSLPCARVWCSVHHLFSFSHWNSEGSSPAPPKLSCELPPFV